MMFLRFFLNGTALPILSLSLKDFLRFTGTEGGPIFGTPATALVMLLFLRDPRRPAGQSVRE